MPTVMIPILFGFRIRTNNGRLTHLIGTVFQVPSSFNSDYPTLWAPLVAPEAHAQDFRDGKGHFLTLTVPTAPSNTFRNLYQR